MTLHHHDRHADADEETSLLSRRTLLRRSALGLTGIGFATLLAACDDGEPDEDAEGPTGLDELDEAPLDEDPVGGG